MKDEFEISLDYIDRLYKRRDEIRANRDNYNMRKKATYIFKKTKERIDFDVCRVSEKKIKRYKELVEYKSPHDLSDSEKKELEKFNTQLYKIELHKNLYELMGNFGIIGSSHDERNPYLPAWLYREIFEGFLDDIPNIRLDPLKLIFKVWHKALKKGQYSSNKSLEKMLVEFQNKTKGTDKEYLFKRLDEIGFQSLRIKSLYPNPKNKKRKEFYDKLADFIYQKSFVENINS